MEDERLIHAILVGVVGVLVALLAKLKPSHAAVRAIPHDGVFETRLKAIEDTVREQANTRPGYIERLITVEQRSGRTERDVERLQRDLSQFATDLKDVVRDQATRDRVSAEQSRVSAEQWQTVLDRLEKFMEQVEEQRDLAERTLRGKRGA